jgi:DNA-binding MarR family transcriptional regulator
MPKAESATISLTPIAAGDLTAKQARELVQRYVAENGRSGDALYRAFRAWTWRCLTERRYDSELRGWWELMRMTGALLQAKKQRAHAERLESLCDLVFESIQFGQDEPVEQVLKRVHVRRALQALSKGWMERPGLRTTLGLKESNLSRLLSLLQSRGLIERMQRSRIASFRLTRAGQEAMQSLPAQPVLVSAHASHSGDQKRARAIGDLVVVNTGSAHRKAVYAFKKHARRDAGGVLTSGHEHLEKDLCFVHYSRPVYAAGRSAATTKELLAAFLRVAAPTAGDYVPNKKSTRNHFVVFNDDDGAPAHSFLNFAYVHSPSDSEESDSAFLLELKDDKARLDRHAGYISEQKIPLHPAPVRKLTHG